ncbi:hypothetical protein FQN60_012488, partial [Etheostoma spectabile]
GFVGSRTDSITSQRVSVGHVTWDKVAVALSKLGVQLGLALFTTRLVQVDHGHLRDQTLFWSPQQTGNSWTAGPRWGGWTWTHLGGALQQGVDHRSANALSPPEELVVLHSDPSTWSLAFTLALLSDRIPVTLRG